MKAEKIKENIYSVGAIDPDREMFDSLIALPKGTSYNSFLIKGSEKTALIDTVDPSMVDVLKKNLEDVEKIDYIISNHSEQDHSGTIPWAMNKYPEAKLITSTMGKSMLSSLLPIDDDRAIQVKDGETISLGDKTLKFIHTPWVHWPETMCTYLEEDKILFSCDFFGAHLGNIELAAKNDEELYETAKLYYSEIMMPFRKFIQKHLKKLKDYEIEMICPSHGPIYEKPKFILNAYEEWTSDKVKNKVTLFYVSMHGSTKEMVDYFARRINDQDIELETHDLAQADEGVLAKSIVDSATIVIATPAVLNGMHPKAVYATYLANILKPKTKFLALLCSFGWGSRVEEQIKELTTNFEAEILPPVFCKGVPKEDNIQELNTLAKTIGQKHKEL